MYIVAIENDKAFLVDDEDQAMQVIFRGNPPKDMKLSDIKHGIKLHIIKITKFTNYTGRDEAN